MTKYTELVNNLKRRTESLTSPGQREQGRSEKRSKYQERAGRILDAALELLQRWGYRKTTLDDIARQAGVPKGTVYLHWKTREALFEALLQREYLSIMLDFRQAIANDPTGAMLSSLTRHLVFLVISNPLLKAVLQRDTETLGDLMRTSTGQQLIPVRLEVSQVYLELLRSKGLLRANISIDTQMKMMTAIYMGFFLIDQVMPPGRKFLPDEMVEALVETIHRTFEPEEPPAPAVVEQVTRTFIQLIDQFIDAIKLKIQEQPQQGGEV
jgi:AcrR family transcriptional regulator